MIIIGILNVLLVVLNTLFVFSIPKLPAEFLEYLTTFVEYITAGVAILANYTPIAYLLVLFGIILTIDVGMHVYKFVMWVLRKIPLIGVS